MVQIPERMPKLTARQEEVLRFYAEYFLRHRDWPTQREAAENLEIASTNVQPFVRPLLEKGYVQKLAQNTRRNYELTTKGWEKAQQLGVDVRQAS